MEGVLGVGIFHYFVIRSATVHTFRLVLVLYLDCARTQVSKMSSPALGMNLSNPKIDIKILIVILVHVPHSDQFNMKWDR